MIRKTVLILLLVLFAGIAGMPEAGAIDPITMAILAPVAMRVAEAAKPYVIRSIIGTGKGFLKIGKDAFGLLYLPLGLGEMTIGAPFHKFRKGVVHAVKGGAVAPLKMMIHIVLLPVYMTGAQMNF